MVIFAMHWGIFVVIRHSYEYPVQKQGELIRIEEMLIYKFKMRFETVWWKEW